MGGGCTRCCGEIQDCCRDTCGCCPCKCCKTTEIEVKAKKTVEHEIKKKETRFGYVLLYAGHRMDDNTYTSPILEIHTWRVSRTQMAVNEATMTMRVALGGMQTDRDNADRHLGPSRGGERRRIERDEEVMVLPVESIISIKYSSEIKKEETEHRNVRLRTPPLPIKLGCWQRIRQWCNKIFCCCCWWCNDSKGQVHHEPEQIITTISNQEAERKILITMEYIRYSNIDTPSHVRVFSPSDRFDFYRRNFHEIEPLEFYLLDNYDFEQDDFDLKRMQASTLCRLVTQLKAMIGHYPDKPTLERIIGKRDNLAVGDPPQETIGRLTGSGRITAGIEVTVIRDRF